MLKNRLKKPCLFFIFGAVFDFTIGIVGAGASGAKSPDGALEVKLVAN